MSINPIGSNIPIQISFGGTNASTMVNTNGVNYFDGTRIETTLVGNAGEVLTSNGVGVAPTFQPGGGITGVTLVADDATTASGASINVFGGSVNRIVTTADNASTLTIDIPLDPILQGLTTSTNGFSASPAGNISADVGDLHLILGNAEIDAGNVHVTLGNVNVDAGDVNVSLGDVNIDAGDLNMANTASAASGVINFGTNPYFHNYGDQTAGLGNLFVGKGAGNFTLTTASAQNNTATGEGSLANLTTGSANVCFGRYAGNAITSATQNCIIGQNGAGNGPVSTGDHNVLLGNNCCPENDMGDYNTCVGYTAGFQLLATDSANICIGADAATSIAGTSKNIRIGAGTGPGGFDWYINKCFISGITGIVVAGGGAVFVTAGDQLGVHASSRRYKKDIQDMGSASEDILKLRPVTFLWNKESSDGLKDASDGRQYGLIAEEVAEIYPELVNYDRDGIPLNIRYEELAPILLNELKRSLSLMLLANARVADVETEMQKMKADIRKLKGLE